MTDKQIRICDLVLHRFGQLAERIAVVPYEVFVTDPAKLLAAARIADPVPCRINSMARPTPSSAADDRQKPPLTVQIRQLIAAGQLPGIARYYPHYGPEAPPAARSRAAAERC